MIAPPPSGINPTETFDSSFRPRELTQEKYLETLEKRLKTLSGGGRPRKKDTWMMQKGCAEELKRLGDDTLAYELEARRTALQDGPLIESLLADGSSRGSLNDKFDDLVSDFLLISQISTDESWSTLKSSVRDYGFVEGSDSSSEERFESGVDNDRSTVRHYGFIEGPNSSSDESDIDDDDDIDDDPLQSFEHQGTRKFCSCGCSVQ
jgi:hypothetical protein